MKKVTALSVSGVAIVSPSLILRETRPTQLAITEHCGIALDPTSGSLYVANYGGLKYSV